VPKLLVLAVAARLPDWAETACAQYLARLPRGFDTQRIALKPEPRTDGRTPQKLMSAEAARIDARVPQGATIIALDEGGSDLGTKAFALKLRAWIDAAATPAFVIGGADGLDESFKRRAAMRLRLSSFTLPHALAQVVLCEQIYRAASLLGGHPYHRE